MSVWSPFSVLGHHWCEFRDAGADRGKRHSLSHEGVEDTTGFALGYFDGFGGKGSPSLTS